jgi:hypothetical protein
LSLAGLGGPAPAGAAAPSADPLGGLPIHFEENQGQAPDGVRFVARGRGYTISLTPTQAVVGLAASRAPSSRLPSGRPTGGGPDAAGAAAIRMTLLGADPTARMEGLDPLAARINYLLGPDPARWRTGIATWAKVRAASVYPGIDLVYYGNQAELEYDFVVAPGADPRAVALVFEGADGLGLDGAGDLVLTLGARQVRLRAPRLYQEIGDTRRPVAGRYVLRTAADGPTVVGFEVAAWDRTRPLVIDPVLGYSTYLGDVSGAIGTALAADSAGAVYVAGSAGSGFPTVSAAQSVFGGGSATPLDAFVAKLNPAGSALVYATYLGGTGDDTAVSLAIDGAGNAYVTGITNSGNFPLSGALQTVFGGGTTDAFVSKLGPTGATLVYSTYLGGFGEDTGLGIAVAADGSAFVSGGTSSLNFPTTAGSLRTTFAGGASDAFVARLNPAGSALTYSTFLGGSGADAALAIALDAAGNAYVTGSTGSTDFPTRGPVQILNAGLDDVFVAKLNPTGTALVYSTYLGGVCGESGNAIAVDGEGQAYVAGHTGFGATGTSLCAFANNFPTTSTAFARTPRGGFDAFVARLDAAGSALLYSTLLGGGCDEIAVGIGVDGNRSAYVAGTTGALVSCPGLNSFPIVDPIQSTFAGARDAFVTKLNPTGSFPMYSTLLGGTAVDEANNLALDPAGRVYVTGSTTSLDFPVLGAIQPAFAGALDAFVTRVNATTVTFTATPTAAPPTAGTVTLTFAGGPGRTGEWVGLFPVTAGSTFVDWQWITGGQAASGVATSGTLVFPTRTITAGAYVLRWMSGQGAIAESETLTLASNPVPVLTSIDPASVDATTAPPPTLRATGSGFTAASVIQVGGAARATTLVSSTELTTTLTAGDLVAPAGLPVTVFNPAPGGGTSAARTLAVTAPPPAPTLGAISPTSVAGGGVGATLTVFGADFRARSIVRVGGTDRVTTFVSATELRAILTAADLAATGTLAVTVFTPAPGGGTSGAATLAVVTPTVTPNVTLTTLTGPVTVTLANGPGRAGEWVGLFPAATAGTGGYVDWQWVTGGRATPGLAVAGTLTFPTGGLRVGAGTYVFRWISNGAVIATSAAVTFADVPAVPPAPALTGVAPTTVVQGSGATVVRVLGAGFVSTSVVQVGGVARATTVVSATELRATLTAGEVGAAAGTTYTFTVMTPAVGGAGGGTSAAATVTVTPAPSLTLGAATIPVGGPVTVTLADGPGRNRDWIGLFPTSTTSTGGHVDWQWTTGGRAAPGVATAAVLTFPTVGVAIPAGTYVFRLISDGAIAATSATLTVGP